MFEVRRPIQPWLYPQSDLEPQPGSIFQKFTGGSVVMALHIRGIAEDPAAFLGVRVTESGQVSAAIAERTTVVAALGDDAPNFDLADCDE